MNAAPRLLTYTITFRCNARCIMCDSWKKDHGGELTLEEVRKIFSQLPHMDAVRLTGGEPFIRSDILGIFNAAVEQLKPARMVISTNAFRTEEIVYFCGARNRSVPLEMVISLDGLAVAHDRVRGVAGAFDRCVATIQALHARQRELNLRFLASQTIVDSDGISQYRLLRDELKKYGVPLQLVVAYNSSAAYSIDQEACAAPEQEGEFHTFGKLEREELASLFSEFEHDLAAFPLPVRTAKRYYLHGIRARLLKGVGEPNPPCVALASHLRVFPNGDVVTCQNNTTSVGNLREQPFQEAWNNSIAARQREWVRQCPGCWSECETLPSAIYTLDILRGLR
jgi:Fe-coproporphyrin III synthase